MAFSATRNSQSGLPCFQIVSRCVCSAKLNQMNPLDHLGHQQASSGLLLVGLSFPDFRATTGVSIVKRSIQLLNSQPDIRTGSKQRAGEQSVGLPSDCFRIAGNRAGGNRAAGSGLSVQRVFRASRKPTTTRRGESTDFSWPAGSTTARLRQFANRSLEQVSKRRPRQSHLPLQFRRQG